jgi:N-acetylmuramoyl-L-alanine amidase
MSYTLKEQLANPGNYGGSRNASQIRYLVYHYTGNDGDKAANNANYFKNNIVKASAHYFVDDAFVYLSVPENRIAYAVGGSKYANASKTGGGTMYGVITNTNSISIEMCDTIWNGVYQASEATLANAAALGRALMEKYGIPIENVYRHFDVTGKHCPSYLVDAGKWAEFKERLEEPMDIEQLTEEQLLRLAERMQAALGKCPLGSTLALELEEAKALGITDGSSPNAFCTRAQAAVMVKRAK